MSFFDLFSRKNNPQEITSVITYEINKKKKIEEVTILGVTPRYLTIKGAIWPYDRIVFFRRKNGKRFHLKESKIQKTSVNISKLSFQDFFRKSVDNKQNWWYSEL